MPKAKTKGRRGGKAGGGGGRGGAHDGTVDRFETERKSREQYKKDREDYNQDTNQFWKPATAYPFSRLAKPLSPQRYETEGCGFPLPEFSFEGMYFDIKVEPRGSFVTRGIFTTTDTLAAAHETLFRVLSEI